LRHFEDFPSPIFKKWNPGRKFLEILFSGFRKWKELPTLKKVQIPMKIENS